MSVDRFEELVIAHAVDGTLDAEGARELISHLAGCAGCRILLQELQESASDLALAAPATQPPETLEARILDAVRASGPPRVAVVRRTRRMLSIAAAAAVLALGSTSIVLYRTVEREREARREIAAALQIIGDPEARVSRMRAPDGDAGGILAFEPGGDGVLVIDGLAPTPTGKVHELWLIVDGTPEPIEVFRVTGDRTIVPIEVAITRADAAAITLEEGPRGSPVPSGDMLLTGSIASRGAA
jgi:anti-sigma factor RsiW